MVVATPQLKFNCFNGVVTTNSCLKKKPSPYPLFFEKEDSNLVHGHQTPIICLHNGPVTNLFINPSARQAAIKESTLKS